MKDNSTFWHNVKALLVLEPFIILGLLKYFVPGLDDVIVYSVFGVMLLTSVMSIFIIGKYIQK